MADVTEDQLRHGVIHLQQTWRFDGAIEQFARAVRWGNADDALAILRSSPEDLIFTATELDVSQPAGLGQLMDMVRETGQLVDQAARSGDVEAALRNLDRHRLLCAHRRGPYGVARWSREAERWLREAIPEYGSDAHSLNESADTDRSGRAQTGHRGASRVAAMGWAEGEWYVGRPLLVTANDYDSGLYNGDTGVVVRTHEGIRAAFARGSAATLYSPVRLDDVQTFYAMTVHRAQGSQFRAVSFLLPPPESHLLTRELLYTAVTRATERVMIYGSEEAIRRAITRPANRASGLRNRL